VSAEELEALLLVQEHDTTRDRLRHRRASLPERAELEASTTRLRALEGEIAAVRTRRDVVLGDERRLDDEARTVGAHAEEANARLYSGTIGSPRELQALQADIDMLRKRRSEIEDRELEAMETREGLDAELATFEAEAEKVGAEITRLNGVIGEAEAEIDAELAQVDAAWSAQAASVPEALLADYQRRRAQNRGAGAARLVGTTCGACHLSIPSTEAERIRRAAGGVVAYCDNCGAILVP
jgi:predicted  nucleic acid-binding Zn-ribbon protein